MKGSQALDVPLTPRTKGLKGWQESSNFVYTIQNVVSVRKKGVPGNSRKSVLACCFCSAGADSDLVD